MYEIYVSQNSLESNDIGHRKKQLYAAFTQSLSNGKGQELLLVVVIVLS